MNSHNNYLLIKNVSGSLLEGINKNISVYGFRFNKSKKIFERSHSNFIHIIDFIFLKNEAGIYIEPIIKIKSLDIENIYHKVTKKESKYYDGTVTLGNSIFKIIEFIDNNIEIDTDKHQYYLVEEEKDINILIKVISEKIVNFGLLYFEQNSTIDRVDFLLNKHPQEISIHNWLYPMRACIGLIAAKLNANPNYNVLASIYKIEMQDAADPYKDEFLSLLEILNEEQAL